MEILFTQQNALSLHIAPGCQEGVWILMSSQCIIIHSEITHVFAYCSILYIGRVSIYIYVYPCSSRSVTLTTRLCDHSASRWRSVSPLLVS